MSRYGITLEQYEMLLRSQGYACAVCRETPDGGRPLVVDHCHESGRVRALLCGTCNTELGSYERFHKRGERFLAKYGQGNPLLYGTD
jgi:hypothetical protein